MPKKDLSVNPLDYPFIFLFPPFASRYFLHRLALPLFPGSGCSAALISRCFWFRFLSFLAPSSRFCSRICPTVVLHRHGRSGWW